MAQDPYRYFRVEARELIEQLGQTILALEKGPSPDLVARLLRYAHTLKGAARVVKQTEIADRAHALESAAGTARESTEALPRERIDALLALVDEMGARLAALGAPEGQPSPAPRDASPSPASRGQDGPRTTRAEVSELDDLLDGVTELHAQLAPVRRALDVVERAQRLSEVVVDQLVSPRAAGPARLDGSARSVAEELRGLLSELERSLSTGVDLVDRELAQVRRATEQLRMIPASAMFTALERAARDAGSTLGKGVVFEGRGGDVRLDAQVLSAVQGALVQVVRNAVAHGIETPAERSAAGKAAAGRLTLDVARRGRLVAFVATDDGRGVDLEAVRRVAQRQGMPADAARRLGTDDLLRLLLRGGVSTAAAVTEMAGRGVGLDVVRETAERLGGEVAVSTRPRAGTTVEMLVPVSVASQDALLVEAAGIAAALPLDAVEQSLLLRASDVARGASGESVVHAGRALPFLSLAAVLASDRPGARGSASWPAVVVRGSVGAAVVGVDRLLGTRSVVMRSLPKLAPATAVVAGATLDADGDPQLVLDPDALVAAARQARPGERAEATRRAPVLVVDDSLTTRMLERSILEAAGYDVEVAASAEEGLEKARLGQYGLFLVDIEMPGMDGFTFIERTRADATLRHVPAILVSSRASPEDRQRGREVGAIDYMVKSDFDQVALLARIREHVG